MQMPTHITDLPMAQNMQQKTGKIQEYNAIQIHLES